MLSALTDHSHLIGSDNNMPVVLSLSHAIAFTLCQEISQGFPHSNTFNLHSSWSQKCCYKRCSMDEESEFWLFTNYFRVYRSDRNISISLCENPHSSCWNWVSVSLKIHIFIQFFDFFVSVFLCLSSPMTVKGWMLTILDLSEMSPLSSHPFHSFSLLYSMLGKSPGLSLVQLSVCQINSLPFIPLEYLFFISTVIFLSLELDFFFPIRTHFCFMDVASPNPS